MHKNPQSNSKPSKIFNIQNYAHKNVVKAVFVIRRLTLYP